MTNLFGEFVGTFVLCSFGCGVVADVLLKKSKGEGAGWMEINVGWGLAVMMGVFAAVSTGAPQADINPAVTMAKVFMGVYSMSHALTTMVAQTAGGFAAGCVVWLIYLPHWKVTEDKGAKLGIFSTGPAILDPVANFLCEFIVTIFLVLGIFFIVKSAEGQTIPFWAVPYLVGGLVCALGMSFGGPTGYAINPARDLGPRLAHAALPIAGKGGSDWGYAWIPVAAPLCGGAVAFFIGRAIGIL
ncbi:aquaporin family protein [Aminithiophilus ramosus]|uniref:Aquaporin family protein n=2 Tax=Synergistales TaxID=649776 RepID=A0A9Q7ALV5_9BACT|nr:MIP/aquaporin family protein [Aminithiophilus ramosus]QTX32017.1 aquaporin family protein [Aminithiophilus ramosus]QVL35858.1 aquaporin family protein [Synergistota bacterium]